MTSYVLLFAENVYTKRGGECRLQDNHKGKYDDSYDTFFRISQAACKAKCDSDKHCSAYEYTDSLKTICKIFNKLAEVVKSGGGTSRPIICFIKGITALYSQIHEQHAGAIGL